MREIAEELGCRIEVTGWLAGSVRIGGGLWLTMATAELIRGEPDPVEHDAVRWVAPEQLHDLDWLDADRPFLGELRTLLLGA